MIRFLSQQIFLMFSFSLISLGSVAQSPQQWAKFGRQALKEGDLNGSIVYFERAAETDSSNLGIWMEYGEALRMNNEYRAAAEVYQYIWEDPYREKYWESLYWWAKMQQNLGQYEDAAHNFKNFENYHAERGSFLEKDAEQQVKACVWAQRNVTDTIIDSLFALGVDLNSSFAEFGATLVNDTTLVYSSLQYDKKDSSLKLSETELNNRVMLYEAVWKDNQWFDKGPMDTIINSSGFHTANASYYKPWKWLLFTRCPSYSQCQIYYSELIEGEWSDPEILSESINLPNFNNTQPHMVDFGGKPTLFFASNRPQGKGQLDIWYSQYNERLKGFTYPKNMGRKVNSPGNEITPYFLADSSELYFSSDWHSGYGGFDVFMSRGRSLRSMGSPSNAGQVINSSANDFYYKAFRVDSLSFISSNRPGGMKLKGETCCNDLYYFKHEPVITVDTVPDTTELVPLITTVEELNEYLPVLYFHNDQPNPRSWKTTTKKTYLECYEAYRKMKVHYLNEYTKGKKGAGKDTAIVRIDHFYKEKIEKGIEEFDLFMDLLFGQLEKGKSVLITIKGYASPLAKSDYNINLTQRRIQSLINYLEVYKNGELKPYMDGTAANGARVTFEKIPYGDSQAARTTSDDLNDKINSVYSPDAMEERRIEILHVEQK